MALAAEAEWARRERRGACPAPPWHWGLAVFRGGAPLALLQTGSYGFAPLAHGAIIAPSTVTIVGAPIVGEIPGPLQIGGLVLVTIGLLITIGVVGRLCCWIGGWKR